MNRPTVVKKLFLVVVSSIFFISNALAGNKGPTFVDKKYRAIRGYDTVAYFSENKAVKGKPEFQHEWNHGIWYFSSQANLELFKASPEKYAPQYGGYCAYAVAIGSLASIDPTQFTILDSKLYLNYNPRIQRRWQKKRDEYLQESESNWPNLLADINAKFKG